MSETTDNSFTAWQKKALFLCKRGNLETELLLNDYILALQSPPNAARIELLDHFLAESDQNLFHWLLGTQNSPEKPVAPIPDKYLALIAEIKDNYLNSNG